jgi:DNA-binding transcriptional ArsR family regulator
MSSLVKVKKASKQLKLLADETRLAVVVMLMKKGMYVSQMLEALKIDPTLLSHHLRLIRDSGLAKAQRIGKTVFYQIDKKKIEVKGKTGSVDLGDAKITISL